MGTKRAMRGEEGRREQDEGGEVFFDLVTGKKLDEASQELERSIWARMREISRLGNAHIQALTEEEFSSLHDKALESLRTQDPTVPLSIPVYPGSLAHRQGRSEA